MKYQTISQKQFYPARGAIYYVAIATVIFSHVKIMLFSPVKISCFRAKAHLVFHWCLYNKIKFERNRNYGNQYPLLLISFV